MTRRRGCTRAKEFIIESIQIGKYLVSPLVRRGEGGAYQASVSIRSGRGTSTHDRVFTLKPVFFSAVSAAGYALGHGRQWVSVHGTPAAD